MLNDKINFEKDCYRPMPNKGSFVAGRGYTKYYENPEWVCMTNYLHGCPEEEK